MNDDAPEKPSSLSVQSGYDLWATVYDHDANPLLAIEEPVVRKAIGSVGGLEVLDIGCGTGRHALRMATEGARVTGVDFSGSMLEEARRKSGAGAVRFVVHDLHEPLPFEREFDLAVCGLVLEHIRNLDAFYESVRGVLKKGGRAVFSLMHPVMFLRGTQARFTDPHSDRLIEVDSWPHSVSDLVMAGNRAGFQLLDISEHSPDEEFSSHYPRAQKYVGWPMLVVHSLALPTETA